MRISLMIVAVSALGFSGMAYGQTPSPAPQRPGVITGGADGVMVNGKPAARGATPPPTARSSKACPMFSSTASRQP